MAADRTIHIVDDDARFRTALQRLLQAAGFGTVQYGTPQAFLDAAPGLAGRCVLLDVRMPGIDGLQILERMQALGSRMPVILMTGYGDIPTAVRALKAGACDFIEKPFDDEHLILAIEAAQAGNERDVKVAEAAKSIATLSRRSGRCWMGWSSASRTRQSLSNSGSVCAPLRFTASGCLSGSAQGGLPTRYVWQCWRPWLSARLETISRAGSRTDAKCRGSAVSNSRPSGGTSSQPHTNRRHGDAGLRSIVPIPGSLNYCRGRHAVITV